MELQATKLRHLDRTRQEPREKNLLPVKIVGVRKVNQKIRLLRLGLQEGPSSRRTYTMRLSQEYLKFLAGQWLDVFIPGDPRPGGFTIASAPSAATQAAEPHFELAVQEAPDNPAAAWLWRPENDILGQELTVRIGGSFICPPKEGLGGIRRIVLVAGGVGINPLMSMLSYLADESRNLDIRVSLMYATKVPEDGNLAGVLFLDRIVDLFRRGQVAGEVELFLTGPVSQFRDVTADRTGQVEIRFGRMTREDLMPKIRASSSKDDTLVYVCGPPAMTDYFVEMLTAPGMASIIDAACVKSEKWW
ncbi:Oxidoreductase NAD-binding domain-containing protein 1 [Beauveria bassiana]|uniref:Oxidoreductase NAD-binding domain-containing protein 1 n=1 Tax=Beauveria bassiana TaxID=176275 RepID=A0A2N6NL43_BEABA|nr:Oxidoreductase NAD-binding domain-containing protein 1 [Beauveria bassiana]